jgi:hypothetical protein
MTLQKTKNNTTEDLTESEEDECSGADFRRMMTRMFNELKEKLTEDMQKQLMNPKRTWIKNSRKHRNI